MGATAERRLLIEEHLPLVQQVVAQVATHFPRYVDRQELARAGTVGLVEAAQRYDESRGVPFEKFAARRIRGAILDSLRAADWAPRSVRTLARRLDHVEQRLASKLGHLPNQDQVAAEMGLSREELRTLRDSVFRSVVLALEHGSSTPKDSDLSLADILADRTQLEPSEQLESHELLGYLHDAIQLLPSRHREVIVGYFLEGQPSLDLANYLGVTESRVSQMRTEALTMLKEGIQAQYQSTARMPVVGRAARRKADYARAIGTATTWRERLAARETAPVALMAS